MGFSLYWKWDKPINDAEKFAAWSRDVQYLYRYLTAVEYRNTIPAIFSFDKCYQAKERGDGSRFLVEVDPPPRQENWLVICGPQGAGEPIFTVTEVDFNGNASTGEDYAPFVLSFTDLERAPFWGDCKTGWAPYANLVICALVRFIQYFPEAAMWNDEAEKPISKAAAICKYLFGENSSPHP